MKLNEFQDRVEKIKRKLYEKIIIENESE